MISELITSRITKAKAKVKPRVKHLCRHKCERSPVSININTKAKATKYFGGNNFTLISVATVEEEWQFSRGWVLGGILEEVAMGGKKRVFFKMGVWKWSLRVCPEMRSSSIRM